MFYVYKKNNQKLVSWKTNPLFAVEVITVDIFDSEKGKELDKLVSQVYAAHHNKLEDRHSLETRMIEVLDGLASAIESSWGKKPIFYKEED